MHLRTPIYTFPSTVLSGDLVQFCLSVFRGSNFGHLMIDSELPPEEKLAPFAETSSFSTLSTPLADFRKFYLFSWYIKTKKRFVFEIFIFGFLRPPKQLPKKIFLLLKLHMIKQISDASEQHIFY